MQEQSNYDREWFGNEPTDQNEQQFDYDSEESDTPEHHPEDPAHQNSRKQKTGNACLSCRRQKTRCEYTEGDYRCKLCTKYNRECTKAPARRRRLKTSSRIADLEEKISILTSLLEKNPAAARSTKQPTKSTSQAVADMKTAPPPVGRPSTNEQKATIFDPIMPDVVEEGLIDKITAFAAFERFRTHISLYFPFIAVPPETQPDDFRKQKPLLFSMLVLAGVNSIRPPSTTQMADHMVRSFADRILYRAERSLELVQCLLLYVCFYSRTLHQRDLNFYQMVHIASTMALDLGFGRRTVQPVPHSRFPQPMEDSLEGRRAWIGCYYLAGQAAISLRHPIFVRWSKYIEECLDVLSTHSDAADTDAWACDLIRLQHIAEDAHLVFSMDDPASIVSLKDPKTQYQLAALEQKMEGWLKEAKVDTTLLYVRHVYANVNLYIHETALHSEHNIDRFRSPPAIEEVTSLLQDFDIAPARIDSLCICLDSIHACFDAFLNFDVDTIRCLSNLYFVRTGYAALAFKAIADLCEVQSSHRRPFPHLNVQFDAYMDAMIRVLTEAGQDSKSNIAFAFSMVLRKIKSVKHQGSAAQQPQQQQQPQTFNDAFGATRPPKAQKAGDTPSSSTSGGGRSNTFQAFDDSRSSLGNFNAVVASELEADASTSASTKTQQQTQQQQQSPPTAGTMRGNSMSPSQFDFNDLDTNMWDVNGMQFFDPAFNAYGMFDSSALYQDPRNMMGDNSMQIAGMPPQVSTSLEGQLLQGRGTPLQGMGIGDMAQQTEEPEESEINLPGVNGENYRSW